MPVMSAVLVAMKSLVFGGACVLSLQGLAWGIKGAYSCRLKGKNKAVASNSAPYFKQS
jgi:hypothetical protein